MSATATDLHGYVHTLRESVPYIHPAAQVAVAEWLREMHEAADHGDTTTFARLAVLISDKIEQELRWQAEDLGEPVVPTTIITPTNQEARS
jgi:hypothetical protein